MAKSIFYNEINFFKSNICSFSFFFHSNVGFFKGGYIGVDIFYVISGFLMTFLLEKMIKNQQLSFSNFFFRRLKRLLPALYFMLIFSICNFFFFHMPLLRKLYCWYFCWDFFYIKFFDGEQ